MSNFVNITFDQIRLNRFWKMKDGGFLGGNTETKTGYLYFTFNSPEDAKDKMMLITEQSVPPAEPVA